MSLLLLLAAGSLPTLISGVPFPSTPFGQADSLSTHWANKRAGYGDVYYQYTGSGLQGWPDISNWVDFDTLFANNMAVIAQSCSQFGTTNPSSDEISQIKSGVQTVSAESGVDTRFIFAVIMQESNGCVRAPTTNYGVRNPGLMQDHNGAATCNEGGQVVPCPASTITQMIRDGTEGTPSGDGLKQCLAESGATGAPAAYRAARIYNSGSIANNDLSAGVATHCYASDIANRLTGWVYAPHNCNLDGAAVTPVSPPTATTTSPAGSTPTTSSPAGATTTTPATSPLAPGAATNCSQYHNVVSGDTCSLLGQEFGFTFAQFQAWNTQINAACTNLWLGYSYCVKK